MTSPKTATALTALLFGAATVLSVGIADAQSLADLARSERGRRTSETQTAPITNETLASKGLLTKSTPSTDVAPKTPAPEASKPPAETEKKTDERGEQWWKSQFTAARENLSRAEAEATATDAQMKKASNDFLLRSDIYNKEGVMGPQLKTLASDVEAAKKRVEEARKKISDLEEDLRRSGGLPGWAR